MTKAQINKKSQDKITHVLEKYGAFFAFSNEQFDRQKEKGLTYVSFGAGGIVPKVNHKLFTDELDNVIQWKVEKMKKVDPEELIESELANYECYYTGDIHDALQTLREYGITRAQVIRVFNKTKDKYEDQL